MATVHGAVLDVLAGDVVAQAPGDYALTSYFAERSSTGPYKAGALAGNAGTMPVTFGRYAEGTADLRLSATLWPVADRPFGGGGGEYRSLTVAWFEPTGNYSNTPRQKPQAMSIPRE